MPRMSKKLKKELAFFLNDRGGAEATTDFAGNASMGVSRVSGLS